ncbi:hypothetical protein [Thalassotalea marina]|uniref:Uncharacterized protein n=2 Tax=Thalassotalea marina TaxID=1673741 RepID=A0A919EQK5_9GAMM|nr:hypothetical protein [Thalassotalea marina]GHG07886.1 hypothetical protein GCM10017161_42070 [Thalassotalea marina]
MIGERFLAPINRADTVEGIVTSYNEDSGFVTLITDDGESWKGYEYQLETITPLEYKNERSELN